MINMEKEQQQELFEQYPRHMHAGKEGPVSASPAPSNIVKAAEIQPGKSKAILTLSDGNKCHSKRLQTATGLAV